MRREFTREVRPPGSSLGGVAAQQTSLHLRGWEVAGRGRAAAGPPSLILRFVLLVFPLAFMCVYVCSFRFVFFGCLQASGGVYSIYHLNLMSND